MNPKVIVIGAGMAGLSAASQLFKSGIRDVLILEASDRIGGRIHTVKIGTSPNPIELGANWIHGSSIENSVFAMAEKSGFLSPYRVLNRWSARFLKEDGTEVDRKLVSQAWKTFREIYDDAYSIEHTSFDKSFFPAVERALSSANADIRYDMKCVFQTMLNYVRFHEGDELNRIAVKGVIPDIPGGDLHIPGGYKQILDTIKKDIPDSALLYNTEVININWNNAGQGTVTLTARGGRKFEAKHVVITCSLGYLKQHNRSLFEPALPSSKANAIATLGFGTVNKIFLEFEKPIFKETNRGIAFAWENTNEKIDACNWYKRLFGFDAVFTNPRIVLGWISGDGARAMETLTDHEIKDTSMRLLRKFLKDDSIPEPVNFFATRWKKNPYILGSYSHRTPDLTANEQQVLAEPVPNNHGVPVLFFAGEATDTAHYGCTHAARDSGIKEANRIVQLLESRGISTTSKL